MSRTKLFFFFIDGVGIGEDNPDRNPLINLFHPFTRPGKLIRDDVPMKGNQVVLLPIDACLGVEGIPQSATGQTTIMTGINAARELGYHLLAFPNQQLLPLIREHSLFRKLALRGIRSTSANLYSHAFFTERKKRRRNMFPVSTLSIEAADIPFRYEDDYTQGKAVFADITNEMLLKRGFPVQKISPDTAAQHILSIFESYDFVFFEYFLTDTFGHSREKPEILQAVSTVNDFLGSIRDKSEGRIDILVVSDHGNAEDMETGDHTLNPVPFLFLSRHAERYGSALKKVRSLVDVSPFILDYFDNSCEGDDI